jgi:predicted phosphate transport protein (TIGR00153 family)
MPTTPFLNMFGRSPIKPLEEHMSKVHMCVQVLEPFFAAVFAENWVEVERLQRDIVRLENEADNIKRELRLHLPNNLFTSVSRSDLLELLNVQDDLANKAKDIAGVVMGRKMIFPESITLLFPDYLRRCIEASKQADTAIHELDELLETGFSGNEVKHVDHMITKLSRIEHETDEMQIKLRQAMFVLEEQLPPVKVMFLYKIIEWTGELADDARAVGDNLQILVAR